MDLLLVDILLRCFGYFAMIRILALLVINMLVPHESSFVVWSLTNAL